MAAVDAIELALIAINKSIGKGTIYWANTEGPVGEYEVISTGSMGLDKALGIGGLPRGRLVEIYGPESSGKTTLGLHIIAEAQKNGEICAFIDAEHALDLGYGEKIGVDRAKLLTSQPDTMEECLEVAETLVRSGKVSVIVIDSLAAMAPKVEIDGDMGDAHMGVKARLMGQALRKMTGAIRASNCIVIFINQLRQKIGVFFGSPDTTPGGNALKFHASIRLDIRRIGAVKIGDEMVGNRTRVKVPKNKCAVPFKECEFDITYGVGINRLGELLDLAIAQKIITKSGSWMKYDGYSIGQGAKSALEFIDSHPDVVNQILGLEPEEAEVADPVEDVSFEEQEDELVDNDSGELEVADIN
jgi:recombination protein RecA